MRSLALRQTIEGSSDVEEFNYIFKNSQMNTSKMYNRSASNSELMSDALETIEKRASPNSVVALADEAGTQTVEAMKDVLRKMLAADHIVIQNSNFDLNVIAGELQTYSAYHSDQEAQTLLHALFDKTNNQKGYLIDTAEQARIYLARKAEVYGEQLDGVARGNALLRAMVAPESAAKTAMGGSTTIASIENIVLSTNLLELIETKDQNAAVAMIEMIERGGATHMGAIDNTLASYLRQYIQSEELDYTFPKPGSPNPPPPPSDFVRVLKNIASKSSAVSPTTNIASVEQITAQTLQFLKATEQGQQMVTIRTTGAELGLAPDLADTEGFLRYSGSKFKFFADSASEGIEVSNEAQARNLISRTLEEAETRTNMKTYQIFGRAIERNLSDDLIQSLGISFQQETQIVQSRLAKKATSNINPLSASVDEAVQNLGLTNEVFGSEESVMAKVGRITSYLSRRPPMAVRNVTEFGDDVLSDYSQRAARGGLGFSSIDARARSMSVSLSAATSKIAETQFLETMQAGGSALDDINYTKSASLLSEMGLSYFRANQAYTRLLSSPLEDMSFAASTKIQAPFEVLKKMRLTIDGEVVNLFDLKNNAFKNSNLNKFTLSFVSSTANVDREARPLVNLVWGANNTLSKQQSRRLAYQLMNGTDEYNDILRNLVQQDAGLQASINDVNAVKNLTGRARITTANRIAESIRRGGIVVGSAGEGVVSQEIVDVFSRYGVDLLENDIRVQDLTMRLVHSSEDGLLTLSAITDKKVDEVTGRTSEVAQREAEASLERQRQISKAFEANPTLKKEAEDVIRKSVGRTKLQDRLSGIYSGSLVNFYRANKKAIGLTALGVTLAGVAYAAGKRNREDNLYEETLKAQPTEPRRSSNPDLLYDQQMKSTRRDPLVTAGVVGNLDRSKIGHHKMGSNKYDHLYGG